MKRPASAGYLAVFRSPGVPRAFAAASLGRLSYATLPLSLLLTVEQATGSFTAAGGAVGAFALGSVVMPVKSRLVDRFTPRRVLPALAAALVVALLLVAATATAGVPAATGYVALAAVAGLAAPPLGPSMRAVWAELTPNPSARRRAYSVDGVSEELLFTIGPLLVSVVVALDESGGPAAALALTAMVNLLGALGLATAPAASNTRTRTMAASPRLLGPLRRPGFALLIVAMIGIGLGSGPLEVAVVARSQNDVGGSAAGPLLAALSAGSVLGGLAWGRRDPRVRISLQLTALVMIMAVGTVAAAATPSLVLLGVALGLIGAASAPTLIVGYLAADTLATHRGRTEATTWISTANNIGASLGAAVAGAIIDRSGASMALLSAAALLLLTALFVLLTGSRLDRPGPTSTAVGQSPYRDR